jgi:uncharacterized membrane protein
MTEQIAQFFSKFPKELITMLIAMVPIAELRGAIPWALLEPPLGGGLSWTTAYFFAVIGNVIPVAPLLLGIERLQLWLRRYRFFDRFFEWLFQRTRRRGKLVERYEALGLVLFVGIPLPITGAWTGIVAAFIFGIPFRFAFPAIILGVLMAGTIVTLISLGIFSIF